MGIRRCQPLVLALWNEADGGIPAGLRGAAVLRYWKILKNMDNYPPGAANGPYAPYNEPPRKLKGLVTRREWEANRFFEEY